MKKVLCLCLVCLLLVGLLPIGALAQESAERLTMEQLEQLREEGKVSYVLGDQGYVTWLQGQFYDGKVQGEEGVLAAVERTRDLLGLDENAQFIKGVALQLHNGYTYYTLRQFSAGTSVLNAIVKVIADGDGNAVAISSSAVPGLGSNLEMMITPEEALEKVKAYLAENNPDVSYTFYPETIGKTILSHYSNGVAGEDFQQANAAYIVYTNNPDASIEQTGLSYLAHYVGSNGEYLYSMAVHSIEDEKSQAGSDALAAFQGLQEASYTGDVILSDGSSRQVTVPVLFDEAAGMYYLADAQRKIAVVDGYTYSCEKEMVMRSSPDNMGWEDNDLITYANYITVYDFFAEIGVRSPNGLDMPIAIVSDYRDEEGNQDNNACYNGIEMGWHLFGSSPLNNYGECVDVMAHEYTHGFTLASMTNIAYSGETGAINESFSDIVGNVVEMLSGSTQDTAWLLAENSGGAIRSMSDPNQYAQPAFVGDVFYRSMNAIPYPFNDNAGVHINNSLLATVAVDLEAAGMSLEDQLGLWCYAACAMTPLTGFEELLPILQFTCDSLQMPQWKDVITQAFEERGLTGNTGDNPIYPDGCGILKVQCAPVDGYLPVYVYLLDPETNMPLIVPPYFVDGDGMVSCAHPAGSYKVFVRVLDMNEPSLLSSGRAYVYTETGWQFTEDTNLTGATTADLSIAVPVAIEEGSITTLEILNP